MEILKQVEKVELEERERKFENKMREKKRWRVMRRETRFGSGKNEVEAVTKE